MRSLIFATVSLMLASVSVAQTSGTESQAGAGASARPSPCASEPFRDFDFWVGQWEVKDAKGQLAGHNVVSLEHNGCVLVEQWRSARGDTGMSLNYYDPASGSWKQKWVGLGLILEMQGRLDNGEMVLEGPLQYIGQERITRLRGTWTPLPDGRVRQHFEESADDGKTWQDWFDGYYSRISGPVPD